jgi:hypothetical protein
MQHPKRYRIGIDCIKTFKVINVRNFTARNMVINIDPTTIRELEKVVLGGHNMTSTLKSQ